MNNNTYKRIKIDVIEVIKFYDEKEFDENNKEVKKPASSISGMIGEDLIAGIFKDFLENIDPSLKKTDYLNNNKVTILDTTIKAIGKNGKMLDRWILLNNEQNNIAFQTEIKNWSVHSLGGKSFPKIEKNGKDPFSDILELSKINFEKTWKEDKFGRGGFIDKSVGKVLLKMKEEEIIKGYKIKPLICFWMPICSKEIATSDDILPFFKKNCSNDIEINPFKNEGEFDTVYFFSASIYLRYLIKKKKFEIEIMSNNIQNRIEYLNKLILNQL